ncbi:MAG: rRNA maturation RNase YbeY [Patescibacteria group bacterium]
MQVELYKQVSCPVQKVRLIKILRTALRAVRKKDSVSISVAVVNEKTGKALNKAWRGVNSVPSVLSFEEKEIKSKKSSFISPKQKDKFIGEIIITDALVKKRAKENDRTYKEEFEFLFIHGILHLMGFTHESEGRADKMEKLEGRIASLLSNI